MAKVVVITGASSGIGAALARTLGKRGDSLVLAARREEQLRKVAAEAHPDAFPVVTDVTLRQEVERLRDEALHRFGRVDVWVNNAGRGINRGVFELTDEDFDRMMAVNAKAALYGMQAILPHFRSRKSGHIINVSSMLGRVPLIAARSAYNAAKAALNMLTANARMELRASDPGINVSLVIPGTVDTDFSVHALWSTSQLRSGGPNVQTAEEVAEAIAGVIDNPCPEVYTNPAAAGMVTGYYQDVAAFEKEIGLSVRPR